MRDCRHHFRADQQNQSRYFAEFAAAARIVTQGIANLDYTLVSATCTGAATAGSTCTVTLRFAPRFAGPRPGAVQIVDATGNTLQTFFLAGIGNGPQVVFSQAPAVQVPGKLALTGMAVDAAGNLFGAENLYVNQVIKIPASGGAPVTVSNFDSTLGCLPAPLVLDGAGNIIVSNVCDGSVYEIPAGGGPAIPLPGVSAGPLAIDAQSNLYVVGFGPNQLVLQKIPAGGGPPIPVFAAADIAAMAFDSVGNLFVSNENPDTFSWELDKVPAGGGPAFTIPTNGPVQTLSVDAAGNLFALGGFSASIVEIPAGSSSPITVLEGGVPNGYFIPGGFALDSAGNLFVGGAYGSSDANLYLFQRSNPPALNFAAAVVKTASADSPQSVQIQNAGDTPLAISKLHVDANFAQVAGSGTPSDCAGGSSLAAGAMCNLSISFIPTTTGTLQGTAVFTDNVLNAMGATQSIALSGIGAAKKTTSLTLTSSPNPSMYGQSVTFTATVTSSGGTPTGTVSFKHGSLQGSAAVTNGVATFTTSALSAGGAESITAVYSGDADYAGSTASLSQTVQKIATTITLTSSLNPSTAGHAVTFTATVAAASGATPTGAIMFKNGTASIGSATLNKGIATFTTSKLPVGNNNITAIFGENSSYAGSTSAVLIQAVH